MEWYKCHSSLRRNPIYKRLSPLARQAFRNAMDAVSDYEQGDKLALRVGKLTPKELSEDLLVPVKSLKKVLQELSDCGFFTLDSDGIWHIAKFTEKTESHAERQRRYRANRKKRDGVTVTGDATRDGNTVTVTRDDNGVTTKRDGYRSRSNNTDSLRSSALKFGEWPKDTTGLKNLAKFFLAAFGNVKSAEVAEAHFPDYLEALAIFRSRGVSIETAWECCAAAREANGGKPLFKARIKKAISFLPARGQVVPLRRPDPTAGVQLG